MSETGIEIGEFTPEPEAEETMFYQFSMFAVGLAALFIIWVL